MAVTHDTTFKITDKKRREQLKKKAEELWTKEGLNIETSFYLAKEELDEGRHNTENEWKRTNDTPWARRGEDWGDARKLITSGVQALHDFVEQVFDEQAAKGVKRKRNRVGNNGYGIRYGDGWSPESDKQLRIWHKLKIAGRHATHGRPTKLGLTLKQLKYTLDYYIPDDIMTTTDQDATATWLEKAAEEQRGL